METLILLKNLIFFFLVILIAYITRKKNKVSGNLQKDLSFLITNITTPCLVITSMAVKLTDKKIIYAKDALIASNIIFFISFICINIFLKFYKIKEPNRSQMMAGGILTNLGFLGFPLIYAMYGSNGLYIASIVNMVSNVFTYTLGLTIIKRNSEKQGKLTARDLLNNTNIAAFCGFIILLTGFNLPEILRIVFRELGNTTGVLSMIIIGLMLGETDIKSIFKEKHAYVMTIYRLILLPIFLIILFKLNLLRIDPFVEKICIILFSMPVATIVGIFSTSYDVDPDFATKIVIMSTLFCIVSLPIILFLYNLWYILQILILLSKQVNYISSPVFFLFFNL